MHTMTSSALTLLWIVLLPRSSSQSKLDLHIEIPGHMTNKTMTSLRYAANKTTSGNSTLNIHIRTVSIAIGSSDLFEYARSIREKAVVFMQDEDASEISCIISSLTRSPLISLEGTPFLLHQAEECRYVMSVAATADSYRLATNAAVENNSTWKKILIFYEMDKSIDLVELQLKLYKKMSRVQIVLVDKRPNETDSRFLTRTWKTIVKSKSQAVIPLVNDNLLKNLLQMETCSFKDPLVWLVQGKFPSNLTSAGQNIVVAFQLTVTNTSATEELKKVLEKSTGSPALTSDHVEENDFLAYDALMLVAKATSDVILDSRWNSSNDVNSLPTKGELLTEYIMKTQVQGLTGSIKINSHLEREVEELQVLNLQNNKHVQIGKWTPNGGLVLHKPMLINYETDVCKQPPLRGYTLRITTVEVHPYVIRYMKEDGTTGYKGFCIDILDHLSRDLGFNYSIDMVPDQKFGALTNGEWNGMIRQLIDKKHDMAVTDLTVTQERQKVVDFTVAFQHYTDDMVMSRPVAEHNLFIFVDPLSRGIWVSLAATVCVVGIITYLLNYFCPYGWKDENGQGAAKEFSLFNSLWFSLACFLQQGTADRPKALSGRIFAGVYWFCILIFVSTYTANLAAFFTAKSAATTIKTITDIINSDYDVGVLASSDLHSLFQDSDFELYQQLWYRMSRTALPNSTADGIEWTRKRKYIFISDQPSLKYTAAKAPCNLRLINAPDLRTPRGMAFALQHGSIYTHNITLALLRMRERGLLDKWLTFWWTENSTCEFEDTNSLESKKVHLKHMVGVYIVLGSGTVLAFVMLIAEILWKRKFEARVDMLREKTANNRETTVQPVVMHQEGTST